MLRRIRALSPRAILGIGFTAFLLYGFPGYMSADSLGQLLEGRAWKFESGHPPLMGAQWGVLDRIVSGPLLMLVLQGVLSLGGLYYILRTVLATQRAAVVAVLVLLFPPVLTTMVVIWKDSQMAAYLLAGIAALLQPRLRIRILGLVLLVMACGMRYNAVAAVVPIVFCLFEWRGDMRWWKRTAILVGTTLVLVALAFATTRILRVGPSGLTPIFHDVTGMIAVSEDRSDAEWREVLRGTPLVGDRDIQARARDLHYNHWGAWRITSGAKRLFDHPRTVEESAALERVWTELASNPLLYLEAHWNTFAMMLGMDRELVRPGPIWNVFLEDHELAPIAEHHATWSWFQIWVVHFFVWLHETTEIFDPAFYAILALLLLVTCCRDRLTLALLSSGLLYELSYFPVGPNPDYRYSHWMIAATTLACVILFVRRLRAR
jgi:hypothetical protein